MEKFAITKSESDALLKDTGALNEHAGFFNRHTNRVTESFFLCDFAEFLGTVGLVIVSTLDNEETANSISDFNIGFGGKNDDGSSKLIYQSTKTTEVEWYRTNTLEDYRELQGALWDREFASLVYDDFSA